MGFIFPLFLLAGLAVMIPIVIHLVNLRKYKPELFPNVRFLKQLQIVSKNSARLHRRWLLLSRILFVLALVVAFAQPFLMGNNAKENAVNPEQVIYVDNSYSMSANQGGQPLLDWAKNEAQKLIASGSESSRFIILTNDHLFLSGGLNKAEAIATVQKIQLSHKTASLSQLKDLFLVHWEEKPQKRQQNFYLFSDFQASTLGTNTSLNDSFKNLNVFLFPIQPKKYENIYIDSCSMFSSDSLTNAQNKFIFRLRRENSKEDKMLRLRLMVNGRMQALKSINFPEGKQLMMDSFSLQNVKTTWTHIELQLTDPALSFDDTFRMVAQLPIGYSILVLAPEAKLNSYLQAAFKSMPNISWKVSSGNDFSNENLAQFSLIVLQDGSMMTAALTSKLKDALSEGLNVLVFPGKDEQSPALNNGLKALADIQLKPKDTIMMPVVVLQKDHPLIKGLFASIPEQLQLPFAHAHFPVDAGLSANEQDIMSFADGSPLLTSFNFDKGKLYLVTASLQGQSSNFPLSYFFAPILYRMTVPTDAANQFITTIGSHQSIWLPNATNNSDAQVWHLFKGKNDWIPAQNMTGKGLALFVGQTIANPGFYQIKQDRKSQDSFVLAVNTNPLESDLKPISQNTLKASFPGAHVVWLNADMVAHNGWQESKSSFPLWKICVIIALLCLMVETWFLIKPSMFQKRLQKKIND